MRTKSQSIPTLYVAALFAQSHKKSPWEKLLSVAQFLDKLEQDFKDVYPDMESPVKDVYEATLRKLFEEKFKGK